MRAKIYGTADLPRLCVTRTNTHIYAQLINDEKGHTLLTASDNRVRHPEPRAKRGAKDLKEKSDEEIVRTSKVAKAFEVGKLIAKKALEKKIKKVIFDRAGYKYHGRVKAVADGARQGGLKF